MLLSLLLMAGLAACTPQAAASPPATPSPPATATTAATRTPSPTPPPSATATPVPSATPIPTDTPTPAPTSTPTLGDLCVLYDAANNDLLTRVDRDHPLDRTFEPDDLREVPLEPNNRYFLTQVLKLRDAVHQPLLNMLSAMNALAMRPIIISGYRSYSEQVLAFEQWAALYPDRVDNLSARPGHSEHQLGTVVDFSAYSMGLERFNTRFADTREGEWLRENAAAFGFTLSYPQDRIDLTGYEWEPWHYRYVGPDLAETLAARDLTLTELLNECDLSAASSR